jgi:hypothetical protein
MKTLPVISLIFLILLASCGGTKDVTCDTGKFGFTTVGFSVADFNGATLRQYEAGSNFTKLKQEGGVTLYLVVRDAVTTDTGSFSPPPAMAVPHNPGEIPANYDYVLSIPALGISDTISNATYLGPTHKMMHYDDAHPAYCINTMSSYKYNGQTITPAAEQPYHLIQLVK